MIVPQVQPRAKHRSHFGRIIAPATSSPRRNVAFRALIIGSSSTDAVKSPFLVKLLCRIVSRAHLKTQTHRASLRFADAMARSSSVVPMPRPRHPGSTAISNNSTSSTTDRTSVKPDSVPSDNARSARVPAASSCRAVARHSSLRRIADRTRVHRRRQRRHVIERRGAKSDHDAGNLASGART